MTGNWIEAWELIDDLRAQLAAKDKLLAMAREWIKDIKLALPECTRNTHIGAGSCYRCSADEMLGDLSQQDTGSGGEQPCE